MEIVTSYFANYDNVMKDGYSAYSVSISCPFYLPTLNYLCYSSFCLMLQKQKRYTELSHEFSRLLKLNNSIERLYNLCLQEENIILLSWTKDDTYCNRRIIRQKINKKKYSVNVIEFNSILEFI